jgi:hypothetical protein
VVHGGELVYLWSGSNLLDLKNSLAWAGLPMGLIISNFLYCRSIGGWIMAFLEYAGTYPVYYEPILLIE